jgi:large subunit ribosomal protein L18
MQKSQLKRQNGLARRHRRVRGKISGTAEVPRLCVFRSNSNIEAQVIDDVKGVTICGVGTLGADFKKSGKKAGTIDGAAEVGKLIGEKAKSAGVEKVVFDRGGNLYHGRVKALADAAREAGLQF